jgi:RNA polymerase sigma factor, sigma-70 family
MDDMALLREYATRNSEAAFAELVSRRAGFVYSAAMRQVRNPHLAEEITQAVFIILAQKAGRISDKTILAGWLFKTTRFAAIAQTRELVKRQRRELEVFMQSEIQSAAPDPLWEQMSPLLDEALATLGETDRQAVLLRFFENKSLAEVGSHLGTGEDTARKRVSRALEKLHRYFNQRGVSSTTAIIAGAISANSVQAAPVALAKTVTTVAIAKGAVASGSTLTLIKGALKIMAWTKAKTAIVVGACLLLAAGTTTVVIHKVESPSVNESFWKMNLENLKKAPPVLIIRPTRFSDHTSMVGGNGLIAHNLDFKGLLEFAYVFTNSDGWHPFSRERMILPAGVPQGGYDLMFTLPDHPMEKLQQAIGRTTGFAALKETRQTDILVLKVKDPALLAFHVSKKGTKMNHKYSEGMRASFNQPISDTAHFLETAFHKPVLVQGRLSEHYDFTFQWQDPQQKEAALTQELEQAGLELVPSYEPIEMLVVEKVK